MVVQSYGSTKAKSTVTLLYSLQILYHICEKKYLTKSMYLKLILHMSDLFIKSQYHLKKVLQFLSENWSLFFLEPNDNVTKIYALWCVHTA